MTIPMFRLTLSAVLSVLILLPLLGSAHLIEVLAGKKECFFEDLHVHDKVHICTRVVVCGLKSVIS